MDNVLDLGTIESSLKKISKYINNLIRIRDISTNFFTDFQWRLRAGWWGSLFGSLYWLLIPGMSSTRAFGHSAIRSWIRASGEDYVFQLRHLDFNTLISTGSLPSGKLDEHAFRSAKTSFLPAFGLRLRPTGSSIKAASPRSEFGADGHTCWQFFGQLPAERRFYRYDLLLWQLCHSDPDAMASGPGW